MIEDSLNGLKLSFNLKSDIKWTCEPYERNKRHDRMRTAGRNTDIEKIFSPSQKKSIIVPLKNLRNL